MGNGEDIPIFGRVSGVIGGEEMAADAAARLRFLKVRHTAVACKDYVTGVEGNDVIWVGGGVF